MKKVLKVLFFPIKLIIDVFINFLTFLLSVTSGILFIIMLFLIFGAIASFINHETKLGVFALIFAFLISPVGLPLFVVKILALLSLLNDTISESLSEYEYLDVKSEEENNKYNENECENKEEDYYVRKHKDNIKLGELGEEFVYNIEKNNVAVFNKDYVKKVERVSKKIYGDKLGYDISSIDINGNELKIEVKTTAGDCDTPFLMSENELRFLKEHKNDGAILYRVYNFNEETKIGQIKKITAEEVLNNYKVDTKNYVVQKREEEINTNSEDKIIPTVLLKYSEDVEAVYYDENIWMRKFMISKLFNVNKNKSDSILNELLLDKVLNKDKNIKKFYIESDNGKYYNVEHFDLNSLLKIGEITNNEETINLKKWIEEISHKYKIKNLDIGEN